MAEQQPMDPQPIMADDGANGSAAIDLGSPVFQAPSPSAGPLSGAAFVSWADRLNRMVKPLGSDGHRLTPEVEPGADSASIDLGSPVTDAANSPSGPPSGASFVAWSSLAERRKVHPEAAAPTVSEAVRPEARSPAARPDGQQLLLKTNATEGEALAMGERLRWLLVGVTLGVVASIGLWAVGVEPPQELRRLLNPTSAPRPADTP